MEIRLKLNDEGSENCVFNRNINEELQVKPDKKKIALFVQAKKDRELISYF